MHLPRLFVAQSTPGQASVRRHRFDFALLAMALCCSACGSNDETASYAPAVDASFEQAAGADAGADADAAPEIDASNDARDAAIDRARPGRGPPYPIVLAHGFFGFNAFAGIDYVSYFFHVKDYLAAHGEPLVFTPAVDPFNDSTYRGAQLADRIRQILAQTGYAKVDIIGHSQGGLDARVVAHDHPDMVAAVVTYATPNRGTPIADIVLKLIADPNQQQLLDALVKLVGAPLYDQVGNQTSLSKPLHLFSQPGIAAFNAEYPDAPGVAYFSIAGRSNLSLGGADCATPNAPPFIRDFSLTRDPIDPLLALTGSTLTDGLADYPNDGLVRVRDAKWGTFLGCVPADHLDEIGQLLGDSPGIGNNWDYRQFFVELVRFLRVQGY